MKAGALGPYRCRRLLFSTGVAVVCMAMLAGCGGAAQSGTVPQGNAQPVYQPPNVPQQPSQQPDNSQPTYQPPADPCGGLSQDDCACAHDVNVCLSQNGYNNGGNAYMPDNPDNSSDSGP